MEITIPYTYLLIRFNIKIIERETRFINGFEVKYKQKVYLSL